MNTNVIQTHNIKATQKVNLNVRVEKGILDELELVAGFMNIRRSDLLRALIDVGRQNSIFEVNGEDQAYKKILDQAKETLPEDFAEQIQEERRRSVEENKNNGLKKVVMCEFCLNEFHHHHDHTGGEDHGQTGWEDLDSETN